MMFEQPLYLFLLWLVLVLFLFYRFAAVQNRKSLNRLFTSAMSERLVPAARANRNVFFTGLMLLGIALGIVALADPLYGTYEDEVSQTGIDVYILLDVSRSMLAEDIAPNRLARAKTDIQDLLRQVQGARVGLIVFAGKPIVKVPLTTDQVFFLDILKTVNTLSAPRGGTAIGDAIRKALDSMPVTAERGQALVLMTDGEDHESMPLEAAKDAASRNVRVLTVAMGDTKEGSRIPVQDETGRQTFLKHNGQEVWSKVDMKTLEEIAQITGGAFISTQNKAYDLGTIYANSIGKMQGSEMKTERRQLRYKRFQIVLFAGVLCLLGVLCQHSFRLQINSRR